MAKGGGFTMPGLALGSPDYKKAMDMSSSQAYMAKLMEQDKEEFTDLQQMLQKPLQYAPHPDFQQAANKMSNLYTELFEGQTTIDVGKRGKEKTTAIQDILNSVNER